MAHNIFGDRFLGRSEPAWHALGTTFTGPMTATEGIKRADMDYPLEKIPVSVPYFGEPIETGQFAVVRGGTLDSAPAFFGFVSEGYELLTNAAIAETLDPLTGVWPLETVGALGKGDTVFFTLDAGEDRIAGIETEAIRHFYQIIAGHGNGRGVRWLYSPVRIVCQNTMMAAEESASFSATMGHTSGVADEFAFRTEMIARMTATREKTLSVLNAMALRRVSAQQVAAIIEAAYPLPKEPKKSTLVRELQAAGSELDLSRYDDVLRDYEQNRLAALALREACGQLVSVLNDQHPAISETAYGTYQAVVELADWREGRDTLSAARSAFDGRRAEEKRRAFAVAAKLPALSLN